MPLIVQLNCAALRTALSTSGVIGSLTTLLAQAGVSVFVLSTFDTDHVLIKEDAVDTAIDALRDAGHVVAAD